MHDNITYVFRHLEQFPIRGPLFRNTTYYCISCDGIKSKIKKLVLGWKRFENIFFKDGETPSFSHV